MNAAKLCLVGTLLSSFVGTAAVRADDRLGEQLGTVRFAVGGQPETRDHVIRGVKLLHHMMYPEADREFAQAAAAEPDCALAWWGRAMTFIHPLWPDVPSADDRKHGDEYLERGRAAKSVTARERMYLESLACYYEGPAAGDHVAGLKALDVAWAALATAYPDDLDAVAFSALFHLAPARFLPKDKSHRLQLEAAAQLQRVAAAIPDHPGAQHYKIHAYDFPLLADRALEVCDSYSGIAPDVPHALHMPTHIYTRRGLWEKSIEFNLRSADAARKLGLAANALNGHLPHALDYLAYAYLQRGQYREADAIRRQVGAFNGPYSPMQNTAMAFAFAAIPARYALERGAWREAADLPLRQPAAFPWSPQNINCDAITHFARGIGAARSGRLDDARREIAELKRIHALLADTKRETYWIAQAETQALAVEAWILLAERQPGPAIDLMRRATALEVATDKEAVTPGEVLPAGDLLGELLLEAQRPADALAAFEAQLAASPNRLNTLYGAAVAAERADRPPVSLNYYRQLQSVAAAADESDERARHAREFVAQHAGL
jgi:hypothetical protein